jgi:hypothetical protein
MENPFADILQTQITDQRRKLPFPEACAFHVALKEGVSQPVVARASGLTQGAISHLARAGERLAGQIRYPKVAQEYAKLGREAFIHKYVTAPIRERLRVADIAVRNQPRNSLERAGVNPRANKDRGRHTIRDSSGGPDVEIEIQFDRGQRPGWKWAEYDPTHPGQLTGQWRGDPANEERGFKSSAAAKAFCQCRYGPSDEQIFNDENMAANDDSYFFDHLFDAEKIHTKIS